MKIEKKMKKDFYALAKESVKHFNQYAKSANASTVITNWKLKMMSADYDAVTNGLEKYEKIPALNGFWFASEENGICLLVKKEKVYALFRCTAEDLKKVTLARKLQRFFKEPALVPKKLLAKFSLKDWRKIRTNADVDNENLNLMSKHLNGVQLCGIANSLEVAGAIEQIFSRDENLYLVKPTNYGTELYEILDEED